MIYQAGTPGKWTNDSQRFLLDHFDTIKSSPSHIYHSALPFCPSSSWLHKCYSAEFSQEVKVVKGLPAGWGKCSRTVACDSIICLSCWNNTIAVGSKDGDVIILDAVTGSQTATFSGHEYQVNCLAFSLDGRSLASGGYDRTIKLWDMQTGGTVRTFSGHTGTIYSISISADFATIASGSIDQSICLWGIHTGECYHVLQQVKSGDAIKQVDTIDHVRFSPTTPQHLLYVCNRKVHQWDINNHQAGPTYDGHGIAFSPDGTQVAVCNLGSIIVQNPSSGMIVTKLHMANGAYPENCCFSPDGKLVAVSDMTFIHIWDITSPDPHPIQTFPGGFGDISTLLFASPSSLISTQGNFVKFWQIGSSSIDLAEIDPGFTLADSAETGPGSTSLISAGGQLLTLQAKDGIIITSEDEILDVWDTSTSHCKASFQIPIGSFSKQHAQLVNGRLIFTSWEGGATGVSYPTGGKVYLWDVEEGELLWAVDTCGYREDIKISQDGSRVFCLYEESLQALSAETGEVMGQVEVGGMGSHLTVDGFVVWVHYSDSEYQGWDFGTSDVSPIQSLNVSLSQQYLNGTLQWVPSLCGIKNETTGKVVFWVPKKYGRIFDVQWNEHYLVVCFKSKEVLILDFSHIL